MDSLSCLQWHVGCTGSEIGLKGAVEAGSGPSTGTNDGHQSVSDGFARYPAAVTSFLPLTLIFLKNKDFFSLD